MGYTLEFFDRPATFLSAAGSLLAASPVPSTVVVSVTGGLSRETEVPGSDPDAPPRWWVVVRDDAGEVVGAGMRTAPAAPYPPYLLTMPEDAARLLARTLHERGETVTAVNGAVPTIDQFAAETAALTGSTVRSAEQMNLYVLGELVEPSWPAGVLRVARPDEVDLVLAWFDAFSGDASAQAGRHDPHPSPIETHDSTTSRIARGEVWLWEDASGTPAHVTAFHPARFGVARVGPVYTPAEHRGHGYAAAAVAQISRRLLDEGAQVCLFADIENQVSTAVYVRLGYRPIGRTGSLHLD